MEVSHNGARMCDSGPLCEFLLSRTLLKTKSSRTERDVSSDGMLKVVPCPKWSLPHRRHKGEPVNGWLSSDAEDAQTGHGRWFVVLHKDDRFSRTLSPGTLALWGCSGALEQKGPGAGSLLFGLG